MKPAAFGLVAGLALSLSSPGLANDLAATAQFNGTVVSFQLAQAYGNLTLSVAGPNSFQASATFRGGAPYLDLARFGVVGDGTYTYHLTASTNEWVAASTQNAGRPASASIGWQLNGVSKSGTFGVKGGAIVVPATSGKRDGAR